METEDWREQHDGKMACESEEKQQESLERPQTEVAARYLFLCFSWTRDLARVGTEGEVADNLVITCWLLVNTHTTSMSSG